MKKQFYKNRELFKEIVFNLKAHKLRTLLTAFGIAWGIFILVVLLGISGGLKEGVFELFKGFSSKTIWFYGGTTKDNIAMRDTGEEVRFDIQELDKLKSIFPEIASVSSEIQESYVSVQYEGDQDYFNIVYTSDQTFSLKNLKTEKGRAINRQDIKEHRNVAVIGDRIANRFFPKENPIGKQLIIRDNQYLIIGVLSNKSILSLNEQQNIFIPATAFSEAIRPANYISAIGVTVEQSYKMD